MRTSAPRGWTGWSAQQAGKTSFAIHTRTTTGARYVAQVDVPSDPGFLATSLLMSKAGPATQGQHQARRRASDGCWSIITARATGVTGPEAQRHYLPHGRRPTVEEGG